jgi:hypothetical protein
MQEKRKKPRRDIQRAVHVLVPNQPPLPCALLDVSQSGARLDVPETAQLPEYFVVVLSEHIRRWARVMRRSGRQVGIRFVAEPQSTGSEPPAEGVASRAPPSRSQTE